MFTQEESPLNSHSLLSRAARLTGFLALLMAGWSGVRAQQPIAELIHADEDPGLVTIRGTVLGTYDNTYVVVRDSSGIIMAHIDERHWELGLHIGDSVTAMGTLNTANFPQNYLSVERIERFGERDLSVRGLQLLPVGRVLTSSRPGDLVAVVARVTEISARRIQLADPSGSVALDLGPRFDRASYRFSQGEELLVIATVAEETAGQRALHAVAIQPAAMLRRAGDPTTVVSVADVLRQRPLDQRVRVAGSLGFAFAADITSGPVPLLNGNGQSLVIRLAPQYRSLIPSTGVECHVVGTFTTVEYRGEEFGVLADARIDLPR